MRGAAAVLAGALLRGGELAGAGRSTATGARLGRGLVQKDERNTCDPLGPRAWVGDGRSVGLGGGAARHGGARRSARVLASGTTYGPKV